MGSESESLKLQGATLIRCRGMRNGSGSRRMYRQEASEIQDEPRADLIPFKINPSRVFHLLKLEKEAETMLEGLAK